MRTLLTVQMDTEKTNQAITGNTLAKTMKSALDRLEPEAAFFTTREGMRTAYIVFDLNEPSDIPTSVESFFQELGAKVTMTPAMVFDDVQEGLRRHAAG